MIGIILTIFVYPAITNARDDFREDVSAFEAMVDYGYYLDQYISRGTATPNHQMFLFGSKYSGTDMDLELIYSDENHGYAVRTTDVGYIEWEAVVPEAGLYNIEVHYYPIEGQGTTIERELSINGQVPFEGAAYLNFTRVWGDGEEIRKDNQGNELRPLQVEHPSWQSKILDDSRGNYMEPYYFFLNEGVNTLRLTSRREPMLIDYVRIFQAEEPRTYSRVLESHLKDGQSGARDVFIKLQERDSTVRSGPTLAPQGELGDPTLEPYDTVLMRLNMIGGDSWSQVGQWISWDFEVPTDGFYQIGIKAKQNLLRGAFSNRRILIDGEVPFQEVEAVRFPYSAGYLMNVPGVAETGEPYLFYLTKGKHTITMEVVLGDMVDVIRTLEESVYDLNSIYRQIVMITSPTPDPMRTYNLPKRIPGLLDGLREQAEIVEGVAIALEEYTGQKGGATVILQDLTRQLRTLASNPDSIPTRLAKFRDNLGGLGTWLLDTRSQPLAIDYLVVASPEQVMPEATATFAERMKHEIRALGSSYLHDYSMVGDVYESEEEPLKVWLGWGRDQAQILKRLIENSFTPRTGVPVNLELVSMGVLLPATVAGRGPDVAMGVSTAQPMNFAFRGGVVDLSEMPDIDDVTSRFMRSALIPFAFRDSLYALPDQQPFMMLFYRTDILHELGLEIPNTWDDVLDIIPVLQKRNMEFGLPFSVPPKAMSGAIGDVSSTIGSLTSSGGVLNMLTFLNQNGEELFVEDGIATNLDHEYAVEAFSLWTDLYELYKLPLDYNASNRFRMGEMPLVIANYNLYNELQVFAPELRGKWGFTLMPGTVLPDGTIDRSTPGGARSTSGGSAQAGQTGTMILASSKRVDAAWEFLKWWTSDEVQVEFGRQIESVLGPAGRYPTANVHALSSLPWSVNEYEKLLAQWEWVRGVPEVPGGYMIGRHLDNAFRKVVYENKPARDILVDYNRLINEEIERKRIEFGLPTTLDELEDEYRKQYWVD